MYYELMILPHHAGFGMYQRGEANGEGWVNPTDLIQEIYQQAPGTVYEVGRDELPKGIKDIRGLIQDGDPDYLFAWQYDDHGDLRTAYCGIIEKA